MNRTWSKEQVLESLPALRRMNAQGNDIYVRPAEHTRHGLVLVDDLRPASLARMERGAIARRLAQEYGGDPASTASRQYAHAPGAASRTKSAAGYHTRSGPIRRSRGRRALPALHRGAPPANA